MTYLIFEMDERTNDLNAIILGVPPEKRLSDNFIRIGVRNENSPLRIEMQRYFDGRMCTNPPQNQWTASQTMIL
jgi:hypothetical protein